METIRLFIADEHTIVRAGLRSLLGSLPDFEVVGEASDGQQAFEHIETLRPSVLLTEVKMPTISGLTLAERVANEFPEIRIIFVAGQATEDTVNWAVRIGAAGFLLKDTDSKELQSAIRAAVRGETQIIPTMPKLITVNRRPSLGEDQPVAADLLTPRQQEILRCIAGGQSTKLIARTLKISGKTVSAHRADIKKRLGIRDIPGLVRFAMRTGLISPEK